MTKLKKISPLKGIISGLFIFLTPYLICIVYNMIIVDEWRHLPLDDLYKKVMESQVPFAISFVLLVFTSLYIVLHNSHVNSLLLKDNFTNELNNVKEEVDHYLSKAKIVFESGINEYDDKHLLALKRILKSLDNKDKHINLYAVDNTDPRMWWSDTMTGYLALLANWKSENFRKRTVTRIFVCSKNELLSSVFIKTISLHSLMGFRTYIITKEFYNIIYKEFIKEKDLINDRALNLKKEVFIWLEDSQNGRGERTFPINFKLDKIDRSKTWNGVKCYQSFWSLDYDYNRRRQIQERKEDKIINYYNTAIQTSRIDVWFEFIAKENSTNENTTRKAEMWERIPNLYSDLIKKIIEKSICCKDVNEAKKMENNNHSVIRIKTCTCSSCSVKCSAKNQDNTSEEFDFTSTDDIREILNEYYLFNEKYLKENEISKATVN